MSPAREAFTNNFLSNLFSAIFTLFHSTRGEAYLVESVGSQRIQNMERIRRRQRVLGTCGSKQL